MVVILIKKMINIIYKTITMFDYNFIEMLEITKLIITNDYYYNSFIKQKILNYQYKNPYYGKIYFNDNIKGIYINIYSDFFTYYIKWYNCFY